VVARFDAGVGVFFVLSGFLLFRPFLAAAARGETRRRFGAYLWHRAVRILPAYWVMIVVVLLTLPDNDDVGRGTWVRLLTLSDIYVHGGGLTDGVTQTWSLATEVVFYLLLPLLVLVFVGRTWRPVRTLLFTLVASAATTAVFLQWRGAGLIDPNPTGFWL